MLTLEQHNHESLSNRSISIIWNIEDVQEIAPKLTDEQAYEVLLQCKDSHDANIGINWYTLEFHAEYLYPGSTVFEQNGTDE